MADSSRIRWLEKAKLILLFVCVPVILIFLYYNLPVPQLDWVNNFRPAALNFIQGQPFSTLYFYNAPWTLIPLLPLALLPLQVGRLCMFVLGLVGFSYIAYRLEAKPVSMILFMTSVPVLACLHDGGFDWLPMLSFVTPAPLSLILAAMKPQIGVGMAIYWLFHSWQSGGIRQVVKAFAPVTILTVVSFLLYGVWILRFREVIDAVNNIPVFPYLLPIGLYLVSTRRARASMAAGPFFSPYVSAPHLSVPLVALFRHPRLLFVAWIILWLIPLADVISSLRF